MNLTRPVVSVGIPTYNRPAGLARTLDCLSAQTHAALDILVSDNCSPDPATERVVRAHAERDARVRYVRQPRNLGVAGNFAFVLAEAAGEYFMWAADDDEWQPRFVAACVDALAGGAASAMTAFETSYRYSGTRVPARLPTLSPAAGVAANMLAFLACPTPSLFYGVHRRESVQFFLNDTMFDFYDCYFSLRLIAEGGIALVAENLYTAGVDAPQYQVKPMDPSWGSGLRYLPFHRAARGLLRRVPLGPIDRFRVEARLASLVTRWALVNEGRAVRRRLFRGQG